MDRKRIEELAKRAERTGTYTYTDFMGQGDLASFLDYAQSINVPYRIYGGYDEAERGMIIFGNEEMCSYTEDPPIKLIKILPRGAKYAEKLTHRDYLGALINLGITREMLGDILIKENAYVFVLEHMAEFICDNLFKVKHTAVDVQEISEIEENLVIEKEERQVVISSNRLDAVIARIFNMSRESAAEMINEGRIFINGRTATKKEKSLTEGDRVSVRGHGKFIFVRENGKTKKDRLAITVEIYI